MLPMFGYKRERSANQRNAVVGVLCCGVSVYLELGISLRLEGIMKKEGYVKVLKENVDMGHHETRHSW